MIVFSKSRSRRVPNSNCNWGTSANSSVFLQLLTNLIYYCGKPTLVQYIKLPKQPSFSLHIGEVGQRSKLLTPLPNLKAGNHTPLVELFSLLLLSYWSTYDLLSRREYVCTYKAILILDLTVNLKTNRQLEKWEPTWIILLKVLSSSKTKSMLAVVQ